MKRKLISVLAVLLIAAMLMGSALASSYVKTTGKVYLRTGPGKGYKALCTVVKGAKLTYLDDYYTDYRGVTWYNVSYKNKEGWVSSAYAELHGEEVSTWLYAVGGKCYVRRQPNLNGKVITTMQEGDWAEYQNAYSVDDRGVTWYKVNYNDTIGWVSSRYISFDQETREVYAAYGDSNVRSKPNLNGAQMGILKKGRSATYTEVSSKDSRGVVWYKIKFEGKTGWVSSKYTVIR